MTFEPGVYYVGDPGFVLTNDDLRSLFYETANGILKYGPRILLNARPNNKYYWIAMTPNKHGTLYDQQGNGWGFDWGCFGVAPWAWIESKSSYERNKIQFFEPFTCSSNEDGITIGHLHFTFNPI